MTAAGSTSPSHDARGNISGIGGTGYTYASDNRLVAVGTTDLAYDAAGRLAIVYTSAQQRMDMIGGQLITELDSGNNIVRRYVHGPGVDEPLVWYEGSGTSDRRFLHADERGSIVAVSDSSGAVTNTNSYDEYGRPASGNAGRFGYTGQVWLPEFGLSYYRARMYNPTLGRFMQTDPIGYGAGMNLYAYVSGDPVNFIDPSGLETVCVSNRTRGGSADDGQGGVIVVASELRSFCWNDGGGGRATPDGGGGIGGGPATPQPRNQCPDGNRSELATYYCSAPNRRVSRDANRNRREDPNVTEEERQRQCESARNFSDVTLLGAAGAYGSRFLRFSPIVGHIVGGELLAFNILNRITLYRYNC